MNVFHALRMKFRHCQKTKGPFIRVCVYVCISHHALTSLYTMHPFIPYSLDLPGSSWEQHLLMVPQRLLGP